MEPTFKEIWSRDAWLDYKFAMRHKQNLHRSRNYYRIRSVVRIAFWISYVAIINQLLGWIDTW